MLLPKNSLRALKRKYKKCFGKTSEATSHNACPIQDECIEELNRHSRGTFVKLTTQAPPPPPPRQSKQGRVKCEWMSCANNSSGHCLLDDIKLVNKEIKAEGKINYYLMCENFDWE